MDKITLFALSVKLAQLFGHHFVGTVHVITAYYSYFDSNGLGIELTRRLNKQFGRGCPFDSPSPSDSFMSLFSTYHTPEEIILAIIFDKNTAGYSLLFP